MTNDQLIVYIILAMLLIGFIELAPYIIMIAIIYTIWTLLSNSRSLERFDSFAYNHPVTINSFYSDINDNIAFGNPQSWSNKTNPYIDTNQWGVRDSIIYQAHGIPLPHEDHSTTPVEKSMFYFENYSCRPECCLFSPYSCSNGCVCWEAPQEKNYPTIQSLRTTPTS